MQGTHNFLVLFHKNGTEILYFFCLHFQRAFCILVDIMRYYRQSAPEGGTFVSYKKAPAKVSPLMRALHIIYWIVFAIALVIVLVYAAFSIFVAPPDISDDPVVVPTGVIIQNPDNTADPDPDNTQGPKPNDPDQPGEPTETPEPLVLHRREGVYTCLLAGTDDGNGCADTLMLGVFDVNAKKAHLISIPRDTLVSIDGKNKKINATYAMGGMQLVCDTVETTLGVPVDFYVAVDLAAFRHIVDAIGGVWFTVPQDMKYTDPKQDLDIDLTAGYQLLNGEDALDLVRFRAGYQDQDVGRSRTQRNFLVAMVKQTISLSNVDKVTQLIEILNQYVTSDMPVKNMIYFATQAIGMDLNTALDSTVLPADWIYPCMELRDEEVLTLVNHLEIYKEEVPMEALNIHHREIIEEQSQAEE